MNRDEILSSNKKANPKDEGDEFVKSAARRWGEIGFSCFIIVLMVYNLFKGLSNYSLMSVFWSYLSFSTWYKYKVQRQKQDLITSVCALIGALCFLASYLMQTW